MPLPRSFTRFTRNIANPVFRRFAGRVPGFGLLEHIGRHSGRHYRIPINIFPRDGQYVIGLTYGPETDWAKNVLVAGECVVLMRGRSLRLVDPIIMTDKRADWAPALARPLLRAIRVHQFMRLRPE